jgi:hypothetical protein
MRPTSRSQEAERYCDRDRDGSSEVLLAAQLSVSLVNDPEQTNASERRQ